MNYNELKSAVEQARQAAVEARAAYQLAPTREGLNTAHTKWFTYESLDSDLLRMDVDIWLEGVL
jgi:hypothetical protein